MNIENHIREILQLIGENPDRSDLKETPRRVAESYKEIFSGYDKDPQELIKTFDANGYDEMILITNIDYFSMCEHHMLPFFGTAHVAYIPQKKITGLSKIPRIVDIFAKRLQNQERITIQIADTLIKALNPKGVAVHISGKHLCMCGRGVKKNDSETRTTVFRGVFQESEHLRNDFFHQIGLSS
jgi:GTP cyclohydrolase I